MTKAKYKFTRSSGIAALSSSRQRPSTDATNALSEWKHASNDRDYEVVEDEDEYLVAVLSWNEAHSNTGPILSDYCDRYGIQREFLSE